MKTIILLLAFLSSSSILPCLGADVVRLNTNFAAVKRLQKYPESFVWTYQFGPSGFFIQFVRNGRTFVFKEGSSLQHLKDREGTLISIDTGIIDNNEAYVFQHVSLQPGVNTKLSTILLYDSYDQLAKGAVAGGIVDHDSIRIGEVAPGSRDNYILLKVIP